MPESNDEADEYYDVVTGGAKPTAFVYKKDTEDDFADPMADLRKYDGLSEDFKKAVQRKKRKGQVGTGAESKKDEGVDTISGYNVFDCVLPPYNINYLNRLMVVSPAHAASVRAKVANIIELGFELVDSHLTRQQKENKKGTALDKFNRRLNEVKNDLYDKLDNLNDEEDLIQVLSKVYTDMEATGNGYLEIGRTVSGQIGYIGHIPAIYMRVRRQRDGYVQMVSNRAVFYRKFGDKETLDPIGGDTNPNEIIHFKNYNPNSNFYGIPDIIAAKQALAGNEFSNRYNLEYFENKAVPRYIVVIKGANMGNDTKREIIQFLEASTKGDGNSHRTMVVPLPPDTDQGKVEFKMEPVEVGIQDSSFNNYKKNNLADILMAHRVPLSKIGLAEGVSLAVARDADKTFSDQVCKPAQRIVEKKINSIIHEFTNAFNFKLKEMTLTDEKTQAEIDRVYLTYGVVTANEIRTRWGENGILDGDKPWVPPQKMQAGTDTVNNTKQGKERDATRAANSTDSARSATGRATQGDGRTTK